jgi:hypothetical protein
MNTDWITGSFAGMTREELATTASNELRDQDTGFDLDQTSRNRPRGRLSKMRSLRHGRGLIFRHGLVPNFDKETIRETSIRCGSRWILGLRCHGL